MRYIRLYGAFVRNCIRQAVEFRANFFANLVANLAWMLTLLIFIDILFRNTQSVAGWSKAEMLVLFGTYTSLRGLSNTLFYNNLSQLPNSIRTGTMDFILTKPVNSQFYVSLRYIGLDDLGQTVGGLFVVAYGWAILPSHPPADPLVAAAFTGMLACSLALFYSLTLLMMTLSFWLVRLDNLMILGDMMFSIARTPIDIFRRFGGGVFFVLTYILPLAFIAALPVKMLFGAVSPGRALLEALLLAAFFLAASAAFWRYATRSYSSASS
ncbi:MAG: ABC-2 family transporter protein [Capsulimonadaceae bacterium]|nr:ABC-2 family transporter protein [Capsulimonadaceae bacterium]